VFDEGVSGGVDRERIVAVTAATLSDCLPSFVDRLLLVMNMDPGCLGRHGERRGGVEAEE
jgi:hypothetical protein